MNHQPKAGRCRACTKLWEDCSALPFHTMPIHSQDGTDAVVICSEYTKAANEALSEGLKKCRQCEKALPQESFYKQRHTCKACLLERTRKWRAENRDKYLAIQRRSDKKRKPNRHNPEHIWRWKIKSKYGLSADDYVAMYELQGKACAACGEPGSIDPGDKSQPRLAIDHDHATGRVRGLLCGPCNRAEGLLKTSKAAEGLLAYMRKHECAESI